MQGARLLPVQMEKQWGNGDGGWEYFLSTYWLFEVTVQRLLKLHQLKGKKKPIWIDCLELKEDTVSESELKVALFMEGSAWWQFKVAHL